jgi:hypothetical protein
LEPAFAAQGFDHMVGGLGASVDQIDDFRTRSLAPALFGEGEYDLLSCVDSDRVSGSMAISVTKPPLKGGFVTLIRDSRSLLGGSLP